MNGAIGGGWLVTAAEWDWVYTASPSGRRLHHVAEWDDPTSDEPQGDGRTTCGVRGRLSIPGLLSRMGMERCKRCCDALGWPHGIGSPKNDEALRPLVSARLDVDTKGTT